MHRLSSDVYEAIKENVCHLLVKYSANCIPVSGFELATKMGISVIPYSAIDKEKRNAILELSQDAFYFEHAGKSMIYYNNSCIISYTRLNMSILHEIGHAVLGHMMNTPPDVAEAEARFFAKYAIAPPPLVHRIMPTCPEDIKNKFTISYEAACNAYDYYLKWLNYGGRYKLYELKLLQPRPA